MMQLNLRNKSYFSLLHANLDTSTRVKMSFSHNGLPESKKDALYNIHCGSSLAHQHLGCWEQLVESSYPSYCYNIVSRIAPRRYQMPISVCRTLQ